MNERTRFSIKIYLSHFIRKGWCWLCVKGELETDTGCHILTLSSSDHSITSFSFWLGCSTGVTVGPSPLSWSGSHSAGIPSPTATGTRMPTAQAICGTWLYNFLTYTCFPWLYASAPNSTTCTGQGDIPTSSTGCTCFFRLFTHVHLLIDGSVEGQYAT